MADTPNRAIEILRRLVLIAGLASAAWLAFLTDFRPSIAAWLAPEAAADVAPPPRSADALLAEPREETPVPRVDVAGAEWQAFFTNIQAGVPGSSTRMYFDADAPPFPSLPATLTDYAPVDLRLAGTNAPPIRIERAPAHALVAFGDVNPLPMGLTYRWRHVAWWPLAAALLIYAVLPWFRPTRDQLAYARWRLVLGDFASSLLWGGFFVLPLAVIGGSMEAVTGVPGFTVIPWAIALLGLLSFYWVARHASFLLTVRDDGVEHYTLHGHESLAWADIAKVEGIQITPPRWFVVLSFAAVFLGGSRAARLGQTGRALIVAGSRVNGLRLTGRDGSVRHLWISDQMGGPAMKNVDRLMDGLAREGIEPPAAPLEIRALFPPA
jgi:hypothetical protein